MTEKEFRNVGNILYKSNSVFARAKTKVDAEIIFLFGILL